jgi:hypothetical protein
VTPEPRCSDGVSPAAPTLLIEFARSSLIVREERREGRCWHSTLYLPRRVDDYILLSSWLYVSTENGELLVIDLSRPSQPSVVHRLEMGCRLQVLARETDDKVLTGRTAERAIIYFDLSAPAAPLLRQVLGTSTCRLATDLPAQASQDSPPGRAVPPPPLVLSARDIRLDNDAPPFHITPAQRRAASQRPGLSIGQTIGISIGAAAAVGLIIGSAVVLANWNRSGSLFYFP